MGFRSVFITEDTGLEIPQWFLDKWGTWFHFWEKDGKKGFPMSSIVEQKMYGSTKFSDKEFAVEIHEDLQKVLVESGEDFRTDFVLVWLHECGGITRVQILKDRILYSEPEEWKALEPDSICSHSYCNGCSDHPTLVYEQTHCTCGGQTTQGNKCVKCGKISPLVVKADL